MTAIRIAADRASATIHSTDPDVTDWAVRYFGAWWNASPTHTDETAGAEVIAERDPDRVADIEQFLTQTPHEETTYANHRTLVSRRLRTGLRYAAQPDAALVYVHDEHTNRLTIHGADRNQVAVAAARLAREMVRAQLLQDGWHILHASAVVHGGRALLTLGSKGAGKTTTALLLARSGHELLANDRVFIRPEGEELRILPWPSAAAVGLGLLDALDLYDPVRQRVLAGERLHPTQHQRVTDALHQGSRTPIWDMAKNKELKPQFFPDQLHTWLGMPLATEASAAGLLFPSVTAEGSAALQECPSRAVGADDVFSAATEDRYPDIFGLLPDAASPTALLDRLAALPARSVTLTHDPHASAKVLTEAAADLHAHTG